MSIRNFHRNNKETLGFCFTIIKLQQQQQQQRKKNKTSKARMKGRNENTKIDTEMIARSSNEGETIEYMYVIYLIK